MNQDRTAPPAVFRMNGPAAAGAVPRSFRTGVFRRPRLISVLLIALVLLPPLSAAGANKAGHPLYAVAVSFAPVLNTPGFRTVFGGKDGKTLATDRCGQIRELEFIAFPGTPFRVEAVLDGPESTVYRVVTDDYPYPASTGYFIDSRFVRVSANPPPPRSPILPDRDAILSRLASAIGTPYVWGGNRRDGVTDMLAFFPPPPGQRLDAITRDRWTLCGLDCSGLLYEATNGYTPRNTSTLVEYGAPVPIAGLDDEGIEKRLRPLDLIVWKGHVMIVYDRERIIESRLDCAGGKGGVAFRSLRETLRELLRTRTPLDSWRDGRGNGTKGFVIRRWFPDEGGSPAPERLPGQREHGMGRAEGVRPSPGHARGIQDPGRRGEDGDNDCRTHAICGDIPDQP